MNPIQGPPEPLVDYVFNSSGDQDTGRFQRFNFDVSAGDVVDAEVIWDTQVADTDVRVFLRDETGTLVERNINNKPPARVSVVAQTSGIFSQGSVTSTLRTNQPWWEVRLLESVAIESINLFNRTDCCVERLSDYTVSILDDDGNTVFSRDFSVPPMPSMSIAVDGIEGRTVRVQLNGTSWLSLAEVEVLPSE